MSEKTRKQTNEGTWEKNLTIDLAEEKHLRLRERGIFFLHDDVDDDLFGNFVSDLFYIKQQRKKKKLLIVLNSSGGDTTQCFAIVDAIRAFVQDGWNITTMGMGRVYSATAAIIQAGNERLALPNTQFLLHEVGSWEMEGGVSATRLMEAAKEVERMNEAYLRIIAEGAGIGFAQLKKLVEKNEYYFDAVAAQKIGKRGMIDRVVTAIPFPEI